MATAIIHHGTRGARGHTHAPTASHLPPAATSAAVFDAAPHAWSVTAPPAPGHAYGSTAVAVA
jgi:hypothetical protein